MVCTVHWFSNYIVNQMITLFFVFLSLTSHGARVCVWIGLSTWLKIRVNYPPKMYIVHSAPMFFFLPYVFSPVVNYGETSFYIGRFMVFMEWHTWRIWYLKIGNHYQHNPKLVLPHKWSSQRCLCVESRMEYVR